MLYPFPILNLANSINNQTQNDSAVFYQLINKTHADLSFVIE
ncbi:hypothetical protein PTUN_a3367 [Pseudoalteromonas tunicata]|jgi:hypothetical protein|uniref:Uncharacterized protein n=1 Tax=Pseudoalteromonas tunicata D2 TaxID=87626 RepID=A4C6Y5_9GAMM|nr:hypothetical protein PTUN_a3367 [Pseudoalteromonas tunicata]EAR29739.1 hypothetical protein PTD2_13004 [Pseudoalteromonas tunicata D2]